MRRNSEGCVLPSYFSGTSGLKFFVLGHRTRRSSQVNAGQPAAYGKSPGSPGAYASTAFQPAGLIVAEFLGGAQSLFERLLAAARRGLGAGPGESAGPTTLWSRRQRCSSG